MVRRSIDGINQLGNGVQHSYA